MPQGHQDLSSSSGPWGPDGEAMGAALGSLGGSSCVSDFPCGCVANLHLLKAETSLDVVQTSCHSF